MLSASDTAYPLLKASPTARELDELFTPNPFELIFAESHTREPATCVGLLLLFKTFQRLGYFVQVGDIPISIAHHVSRSRVHGNSQGPCYLRFRHGAHPAHGFGTFLTWEWAPSTARRRKSC